MNLRKMWQDENPSFVSQVHFLINKHSRNNEEKISFFQKAGFTREKMVFHQTSFHEMVWFLRARLFNPILYLVKECVPSMSSCFNIAQMFLFGNHCLALRRISSSPDMEELPCFTDHYQKFPAILSTGETNSSHPFVDKLTTKRQIGMQISHSP